jgi:hypothetical protein
MRTSGALFLLLTTLTVMYSGAPHAEGPIVPTLPQFLRQTSVYVVTPVRLNVSRRVFKNPLGTVAWHAFRIEEALSKRQAKGTTWCELDDKPDAPLLAGEVALDFASFQIMDAQNGPFEGSNFLPAIGARYLAFVEECGDNIMKFVYPVDRGLARLDDQGRMNPAFSFYGGTSLRSLADTRARIAEMTASGASQ